MATKSEIQAALDAARAAGAAEDVAALEAALAAEDAPGATMTGLGHAAQGATAGFLDEVYGGLGFITGQGYKRSRDEMRRYLESGKQAHPGAAAVGEVAGTVAGAAALPGAAGAARGATLATRALRAAPTGAALGAAYGAGYAPELSDVPGDAAKGAAFGALAGPAAEVGASGARLATRGVRRGLALKAHLGGKVAEMAGLPGVAATAGRAEQALLPSPSLSGSKARALARRTEEKGGLTYNVRTGESPTSGFAFSASPENERVLQRMSPRALRDYAGEVGPALKDPTAHLGGWKGKDGWYLDVSRVLPDRKLAMKEARGAGQKSIYDLSRDKELPVAFPKKVAKGGALSRRRKRTTSRTALAADLAAGD